MGNPKEAPALAGSALVRPATSISPEQIAEAIVDRFSRGDIDERELEEAITTAILTAAPRVLKHPPKARTDAVRAREKANREKRLADPNKRAEYVARQREYDQRRRSENPEHMAEKQRARRARARDRDPEAYREKLRDREARRASRNSPARLASYRRKDRAKQTPEQQAKNAIIVRDAARKALPAGLPVAIRDDVIAAVLLSYTEGRIKLSETKAEAKKALTAHNRMFDTFKTRSLDAPIGGSDLRLIDTIASSELRP